jgi:hypothetical protein
MQSGGSHLQGYNCKLLVDSDYQDIVAVRVCNQPQNVDQLDPCRSASLPRPVHGPI